MTINSNYKEYFEKKNIILDQNQLLIANQLAQLYQSIKEYARNISSITKIFRKKAIPKGVYLYGSVGCGKTILLEAFFELVDCLPKQQIHFHEFMHEIHQNLFKKRKNKNTDRSNCIKEIAKEIAQNYQLIFLDELEVHDIADAMIVGQLFAELFNNNVILLISSNRKPDDLYFDGLQRELFLGFIELIKKELTVSELKSDEDYRLKKIGSIQKIYITPLGPKADKFIEDIINKLTNNSLLEPIKLVVHKRELICKQTYKDIAVFEFEELFSQPLGSADYLALIKKFNIIAIKNIPKLLLENSDEVRRFVTFIDILYENQIVFICTAAVSPEELYTNGKGIFEFNRTISRLIEMQSQEYLRKLC